MYIHQELLQRVSAGKPVRAGLIGAGEFGCMFLSQIPTTSGLDVVTIADLNPANVKAACARVGWTEELIEKTRFTDDAIAMLQNDEIDMIIEATGNPLVGIEHAQEAIATGGILSWSTLKPTCWQAHYWL